MSEEIRFDARGLVPVIAQDANTGAVLTLAYANRDALQRTLESNEAHYYSRSRAEIWHKGASSGNTQKVVEVRVDCDGDALLYRVEPSGPACHTGQESCFFTTLAGDEAGVASEGTEPSATPVSRGVSAADGGEVDLGAMIDRLVETIARRHREMPEGSYTAKLLEGGTERVVQKVGEEAVEVVVAALRDERLAEEVADLVYHLLVLLEERGVGVGEVARVLRDRHG